MNSSNLSGALCESLWDTKLTWPATAVDEIVELPCPQQEFDNQTAFRVCILKEDCKGVRPIWTVADYSRCKDPENYTALFLDVAREKYNEMSSEILEHRFLTFSQYSYFQSIIIIIIALTIFVLFRKLRNARTRLHMHMLSATLMQTIMWFMHSVLFDTQLLNAHTYLEILNNINIDVASKFSHDYQKIAEQMFTRFESHLTYIIIAGLERYFEITAAFWLLMEGWFLYELICHKPLETQTSIKRYVIIGWGVPIVLVTPWTVAHFYSSFNDVYWVKHDITVLIIAVAVFVTYMVNSYFFVKITTVLYDRMKTSLELQQKKDMEYKKWVRSTFTLVLLFGMQNLLYCSWFFIEQTKPKILFLLFIKITSSFQGCFVSFIYCFLNDEVQTVLKKNFSTKKKSTSGMRVSNVKV